LEFEQYDWVGNYPSLVLTLTKEKEKFTAFNDAGKRILKPLQQNSFLACPCGSLAFNAQF
jgi:hypothetical protein